MDFLLAFVAKGEPNQMPQAVANSNPKHRFEFLSAHIVPCVAGRNTPMGTPRVESLEFWRARVVAHGSCTAD